MGYSDSFEFECQSNIDHSLRVVLQRSNCASIVHLENVIENGRFHVVPSQQNRLQWVDERNWTHMTSRVKLFVSNEQETAISSLRCHVFSGGPIAITFPGLPLIWPSTYFLCQSSALTSAHSLMSYASESLGINSTIIPVARYNFAVNCSDRHVSP